MGTLFIANFLIAVILFFAYSVLRFRNYLERGFSLYVKIVFIFAGLYFAVSPLSPERFELLAARIVMLCFACIVYIYSIVILPAWPFMLISVTFISVACSVLKNRSLNFFRFKFILPGTVLSLIGAAGVVLAFTTAVFCLTALIFSLHAIGPLHGLTIVVFFSIVFHFFKNISWRSELLRDLIFIASVPVLLAFCLHALFWSLIALMVLAAAFLLLLNWRINLVAKPKTYALRFNSLLLGLCVLCMFNGLAGLTAGRMRTPLEEVVGRPGVALLTAPVKHYSCLLSPDGEALFATNGDGRGIARIPLNGGKIITSQTGGRPNWMDFIPSRNLIVAINGDGFGKSIDIALLNAQSLKKVRSATIPHSLYGVYYSERRDLIYVHTLFGKPSLMALDPDTLAVVRRRKLPYKMNFLFRVRGDEELNRLYLPDFSYNGTLYVADMTTLKTIKSARLGTSLTDIAVVPAEDRLYVAAPLVSKIFILRRSDLKKIGEIKAGMRVRAVAADPLGGRLFAGNSRNGTLEIYDTKSGKKLRSIPTAKEIRSIEVDKSGNVVYVASGLGVFSVNLEKSK